MEKIGSEPANNIMIENRTKAGISGVSEVKSFDENAIRIETSQGLLEIRGSGLTVEKLSLDIGEISVLGRIDGFEYKSVQNERSFWSKIF